MVKKVLNFVKSKLGTPQDKLLAALVLIFFLLILHWTIQNPAQQRAFESLPDTSSAFTSRDEVLHTPVEESNSQQQETANQGAWVANDYVFGDIQKGAYTVVSGDTLWEIAEAVYGNGALYTKIIDANPNAVGFLPNGQQALIFAGQVLQLP